MKKVFLILALMVLMALPAVAVGTTTKIYLYGTVDPMFSASLDSSRLAGSSSSIRLDLTAAKTSEVIDIVHFQSNYNGEWKIIISSGNLGRMVNNEHPTSYVMYSVDFGGNVNWSLANPMTLNYTGILNVALPFAINYAARPLASLQPGIYEDTVYFEAFAP